MAYLARATFAPSFDFLTMATFLTVKVSSGVTFDAFVSKYVKSGNILISPVDKRKHKTLIRDEDVIHFYKKQDLVGVGQINWPY